MPDELSIWIPVDNRPTEFTRMSLDDPFGPPQPIAILEQSTLNQYQVSLGPDGLNVYYRQSTPNTFGTAHPRWARRDSAEEPFNESHPLSVGDVDGEALFVRRTTEELFYIQTHDGMPASLRSEGLDGSAPRDILPLDPERSLSGFATTEDGLHVYFTYTTSDKQGALEHQTGTASRDSTDDTFTSQELVDGIHKLAPYFTVNWVSEDLCLLYGVDADSGEILIASRG